MSRIGPTPMHSFPHDPEGRGIGSYYIILNFYKTDTLLYGFRTANFQRENLFKYAHFGSTAILQIPFCEINFSHNILKEKESSVPLIKW